jgi:hypothetical protein
LSGCLVLINEHDVLIIFYEAKPGEEFLHDPFLHVVDDSELLEIRSILDHLLLDLLELVVGVIENSNGNLVRIVVEVDEAVVQEESAVALLSIAIIDLLSTLDIVKGFNYKASSVISVVPCSLSRPLMVEHVCVGDETISLDAFNLYTENSA